MKALELGKLLLKDNVITAEQLDNALRQLHADRETPRALLDVLGPIDEAEAVAALGRVYDVPAIDLERFQLDEKCLLLFPVEWMMRYLLIPLCRLRNTLTVAFADPGDENLISTMEASTGLHVARVVAASSAIRAALNRAVGNHLAEQASGEPPKQGYPLRDGRRNRSKLSQLVPLEFALKHNVAAVEDGLYGITAYVLNPEDYWLLTELKRLTGRPIQPRRSTFQEIQAAIREMYMPQSSRLQINLGGAERPRSSWFSIDPLKCLEGDQLRFISTDLAPKPRTGTAIMRQESNDSLMVRFHTLVDKRLQGSASQQELAELEYVETTLDAIDERQMTGTQQETNTLQKAAIQKLSELIAELQRLPESPLGQANLR